MEATDGKASEALGLGGESSQGGVNVSVRESGGHGCGGCGKSVILRGVGKWRRRRSVGSGGEKGVYMEVAVLAMGMGVAH